MIKNRIIRNFIFLKKYFAGNPLSLFRLKNYMYSIPKFVMFNTILSDTNYKMVVLNEKEKSIKSNLCKCLIVKSQQLNQLYNSSLTDFSLTFNVDLNVLIYSASLIFLFILLL